MDLAYDHIVESNLPQDPLAKKEGEGQGEQVAQAASTINADFQEAYKAISSSPWGARLGGWMGSVVKQGGEAYKEAQKEIVAVSGEAALGLGDLKSSILNRTRGLSQAQPPTAESKTKDEDGNTAEDEASASATQEALLKESEGVLARLRLEASKRLKDIEKAEDAADEALLKFGTNLRNFLKDAVSIAPPEKGKEGENGGKVLFESKDAQGKRVIHTTRFDAQLHVIHSSLDSFTKDPAGGEFESWKETFNVESKTEEISKDLESFGELRTSMEKLVPGEVAYKDFWTRYYFLRHSIETAEARRRDLLKGATEETEEELGWDDDSDDEATKAKSKTPAGKSTSTASSTTLHPATQAPEALLKPEGPRKSHDEKSEGDSDISYDVVGAASGAPSHAPGSPKDSRKGDDSEEEDWE